MLNEEQELIVKTDKNKVVVLAAPAAGKTTVLVERVKYLLNNGVAPTDIVAITFTNNAADEMLTRLNKPKGIFIGTIHSYINKLLVAKNIETNELIENELFDQLFNRIKKHPECIKPVKHLLVDEAQDSTELHFDFFFNLLKPQNWFFVADWRQSIYGFLGAAPNIILDLSEQSDVTTYDLIKNYRNDKSILDYAKSIIRLCGSDYIDNSIPMSTVDGKVIETKYNPSYLAKYIKMMGNYGKWFVLTRTNEQLSNFATYLKNEGIPYDTFKRSELNNDQLNQKLKDDTVKVLTIHAAKGLEADNVAVIGARFFNTEERCVSYVAATRARHLLIWMEMPVGFKKQKAISWET